MQLVKLIRTLLHSLLLKCIMVYRITKIKSGQGLPIYSNVFVKYPQNILIGGRFIH